MTSASEQLKVLMDGVEEALPAGDLERKVTEVVAGERPPLRVKLGVDPTTPDIHLGHTVVLRKLADFQRLGHTAVLLIGGFTAQVGDPSGRTTTRPRLSAEEVRANASTYLGQARKVLSDERLEVVDNSDWLSGMTMSEVLGLAGQITVARMLERTDFSARYEAGRPIAVSEFLYPLLQGQDSVAVRADVELGGTDQTFNLLVGRDLQSAGDQEPQTAVTLPLLEGTDGVAKMSKTTGNHIALDEEPADMFGKVMSIPDERMTKYFRLLTGVHPDEVDEIERGLATGQLHPAETKRRLARTLVTLYHGADAAEAAEARFDRLFRERAAPEDMPDFDISGEDQWFLPALLTEAGLVSSGSEARRMVRQGAVRLDGAPLEDPTAEYDPAALAGRVLQVGRRRFVRLVGK